MNAGIAVMNCVKNVTLKMITQFKRVDVFVVVMNQGVITVVEYMRVPERVVQNFVVLIVKIILVVVICSVQLKSAVIVQLFIYLNNVSFVNQNTVIIVMQIAQYAQI